MTIEIAIERLSSVTLEKEVTFLRNEVPFHHGQSRVCVCVCSCFTFTLQ